MTNKSVVSIIMYHYVRNLPVSRYPQIKGLEVAQFRSQIAFLKENGFHFISTEDLLDTLAHKRTLPEKAVLLTFDDGYIDHYTHVFPILKNEGISAFFSMPGKILAEHKLLDVNKIHFILAGMPIDKLLSMVYERLDYYRGKEYQIPPNKVLFEKLGIPNRFDTAEVIFIKRLLQVELEENLRNMITDDLFYACIPISERAFAEELYMNADQIRLMQREGMCFGIHGYDHYWMNRLSPEELARDISLALDTFSGIVDPDNWVCCYPYGSCSESVIKYISTHGAVAGFTTVVDNARLDTYRRYELPRFDTNDFPPKSSRYTDYI